MNRQINNQQHAAAVTAATNYSLQNNGSLDGLPANVKSLLTPEDIDAFSQQQTAQSDVNMQVNWIQNPAQMTVDAVNTAYAQHKITFTTYRRAMGEAKSLQGADTSSTDPDKVRAVTLDHDQLTDILAANQLPNLAQPVSSSDKLQRVELETAIRNEIDNQQQQNNRSLSWQEKGKIARDMTIDKVYTSGMFGTNAGLKPVATLTPAERNKATVWIGNQSVRMKDIPPQYTIQAMQDLQSNGLPNTQANIAAWWLKKGMPTQ